MHGQNDHTMERNNSPHHSVQVQTWWNLPCRWICFFFLFFFFLFFFFSIQPENLRFDACVGGKHTKIRLTGLVTVNAMGNKLVMFVIGKSRNPYSFVGAKHLPCKYRNKKNAWIEYYSKNEWVQEIDNLQKRKKYIALITDNCQTHSTSNNLTSVELIFLPPNTTFKLQSIDRV